MSPCTKAETQTEVRKLGPVAQPPPGAVMQRLSESDRRLLKQRLSESAQCVFNDEFLKPDAEERFGGSLDLSRFGTVVRRPKRRPRNDDSGADLLAPEIGSLNVEQERHLFLRFNYARYRVLRILEDVGGGRLDAATTRQLLHWERIVRDARNDLIRYNVPLVLAMARRTKITNIDLSDLVSEGNLALLRSVDKFDCSRGYKFSTYACRAILKSFSRVATRVARYRGYFPTEFDPTLEKSDQLDKRRRDAEDNCVHELKTILGQNLANLNDVEQQVIRARFALDESPSDNGSAPGRAKTLEQVGEMIGVTKERVRQIQNKALTKLRLALDDGLLTA